MRSMQSFSAQLSPQGFFDTFARQSLCFAIQ